MCVIGHGMFEIRPFCLLLSLSPNPQLIDKNPTPRPPTMAPAKGAKTRKSNRSDAGNHTCDACGEQVRNRGRARHKCGNKVDTPASLDDLLKQIAQDEALLNRKCMSSL